MTTRTLVARLRRLWVFLGLYATLLFVGWSLVAYRASADGRRAAVSDTSVIVDRVPGAWRFRPANGVVDTARGLLFFPGALVDPRAYAPLARAAAAAGFYAVVVDLPRRGAFGGADDPALLVRARDETTREGAPRRWIVAGHSRGAVVASSLAASGWPAMTGLVLAGSIHPRDVDLAQLAVPVTKLVGTRDGIASIERARENRRLLPPSVCWIEIEGANHSRFGWYGYQPGDRRARIPADEQRAIWLGALLDQLRADGRTLRPGPACGTPPTR
jgi:pimeloyl-ACP methyl ester carboxylesterase